MPEFEVVPAKRESGTVSPKKKRRGCLVVVLVFFLILVPLGLLLLNGPGFRTIARIAGLKVAASQGIKGDYRVGGSLWSGFSLQGIDLSDGSDTGISIQFEEMSLNYRSLGLIRGAGRFDWLDAIRFGKAHVRIVLPEATERTDKIAKPKKERKKKEGPIDFSPLWNLLASDVRIDDLTLSIHQGDRVYSLESLQLALPREGPGFLRIARLSLPGQDPLEGVDAVVTKSERGLAIGPISLLGYANLETLAISEAAPGEFLITSVLAVAGGKIDLEVKSAGAAQLEASLALRRGSSLSLDQVKFPAATPSKLRGSVTDLELTFAGDPAKPAGWKIAGKIVASNTGWGDPGVDSLIVLIRENQFEVEAARNRATVQLKASMPLETAATTEDLAALPLRAGFKAAVPSLAETLADFGVKVPLAGSIDLEARDLQVAGGKIASGSLLLLTEGLAWDGISLSGGQVAAHVERENFVRLSLDLGLDVTNAARIAGTFDATTKRYEAEASVGLDTKGRLGSVLADLGKKDFSGAVSLAWKGRGGFGEEGHAGNTKIDLQSVTLATGRPITGSLLARYEGRSAVLESLALTADGVSLRGTGQWDGKVVRLPDWQLTHGERIPLTLAVELPLEPGSEGGFLNQPGPLSLDLVLKGLAADEITRFFAEKPPLAGTLNGGVKASGTFLLLDLASRLEFRPEPRAIPEIATTATEAPPTPLATVELALKGDVDSPATWEAQLEALLSGLHWEGMALENLSLSAKTDTALPGRPLLARVRFDQSTTVLDATARLDLAGAKTLPDLAAVPLLVEAALEVTEVETLLKDFAPPKMKSLPLAGSLSATVKGLRLDRGSLAAGEVTVHSTNFAVENETFDTIQLEVTIPQPDQLDTTLELALDEKTRAEGKGTYHLKEKRYEGALTLAADLVSPGSRLKDLLGGRPLAELLPGKTSLDWKGEGHLPESNHAGTLSLQADTLRLAAGAEPLDLAVAGTYTGTSADFPTLTISSDPLDFSGSLRWADRALSLVGKGQSGGREVLSLDAGLPLDPEKLKPALWFGQDTPLSLQLSIDSLPVATISRLAMEKPPLLGDLTLKIDATGTPAVPALEASLNLDGISVPREGESLPVGQLELKLDAKNEQFALAGEYRHPDVKPLVITAALPFHPGAWATGDRKVKEETLSASAKMDRSSLAFLTGQVPGIESIAGEIALDASVTGTIAEPQIRGNSQLGIERLRLENRLAPSLQDIDLVARFGENRLVLERLYALVAGGTLEGSGEVLLKPGGEPQIQLSLKGSEVLVVRTPDVNVRTDLDLNLAGPLSKATLSGAIGITNSRYFKNFDLLPIGMPTKKAVSVLPTVERTPSGGGPAYQDLNFGVKVAPFQDWPVAVRLHTKDPFLIRSNLLESSITADLNLTGTLGKPVPIGQVEIEKGEMSLPFSKVDVETGRIAFDQATGFNGALEFKAKGKADRYQIAIYLYDRILTPQYVLTSIPPLPSEDIITLIATGTTRDELVGDDPGSMAAGKAAGLLFKNLQKKSNSADGDPTLLDLLEERTELELGRVNQETGEQTFGGKIRLWKQLFFVGDVDAQSDYRALLKYVFRFE